MAARRVAALAQEGVSLAEAPLQPPHVRVSTSPRVAHEAFALFVLQQHCSCGCEQEQRTWEQGEQGERETWGRPTLKVRTPCSVASCRRIRHVSVTHGRG